MPYRSTPALLQRAQRMGLSPQAGVMYADDHACLFAHHRFNGSIVTPDDWCWRRVRDRLRRAWRAIGSMSDWERYARSVDRRRMRTNIDSVWSMLGPGEDADEPGSRNHRMMKAVHWEGLWQMLDGTGTSPSTLFQGVRVRNTRSPRREAEARLQNVLMQCGLRGINWPFHQPSTAVYLHNLADMLLDLQRLLQERTGWTGPVLGLGGRLHLALDSHLPPEQAQAYYSWSNRFSMRLYSATGHEPLLVHDGRHRRLIVVLSLHSGLSALAHEWFHAVDSVLAIEAGDSGCEGVSEQWTPEAPFAPRGMKVTPTTQRAVEAMNGFVRTFLLGPMPEHVFQAAADEARDRWRDSFVQENPSLVLQALHDEEHQRMLDGSWTPGWSMERWPSALLHQAQERGMAAMTKNHDGLAYSVVLRTALATVQQRLMKDGNLPHTEGQPFWTVVHDTVAALQQEHDLVPTWQGYLRRPNEMLAHAFESSFHRPDFPLVETCSGQGTLRFPTGAEAAFHAPAWRALFDAMTPWWDGLVKAWGGPSLEQNVEG